MGSVRRWRELNITLDHLCYWLRTQSRVARSAGADVLLSNHTDYDGSKEKQPALAGREPASRIPT